MSQSLCAYCKQPGSLTREHLWPASLHNRLLAANEQSENIFWLARLRRAIPSEPQIRDVCGRCNNGVLSKLDNYICELFDKSFSRVLARDERVRFEPNYHLLKRWLLKMSFNSARIHDSPDREALEELLPYILGVNERLGRSVQLFVQLLYPEVVPPDELDAPFQGTRGVLFEPCGNRVGLMYFLAPGTGRKLLRAVHLRSFSFLMAYWRPERGRQEQSDLEAVLTKQRAATVLLRPSQGAVELVCNGMGAWASFRDSRVTRLDFDADA